MKHVIKLINKETWQETSASEKKLMKKNTPHMISLFDLIKPAFTGNKSLPPGALKSLKLFKSPLTGSETDISLYQSEYIINQKQNLDEKKSTCT